MSIDACYEGVIAKLQRQGTIIDISKKLLLLTTNDARVLYVYELIEGFKAFPKVLKVVKNNNVCVYYRNLGNNNFEKAKYHKAWQYYNLSLLHAPLDSENYCLALSNRSAAFFELKKYKECLEDIEKIFDMKYPQKLKEKLEKRQISCQQKLAEQDSYIIVGLEDININEIIDMKGTKDSRYKCANTKLQVIFNEEMGRHVIAKEDIKVGEVLIEEDPYLTLLLKSQYLICCSYCLSRNLNLFPCDNCCFSLYCSVECKEKAYKEYHKFECPLMATLIHMEFTKLELLSIRTVLKARSDHSDWSALFHTIEEAEANENNEYHGHVKEDGNWVYDSKYYASIHMLASNVEKRSVSDIFQKAVTAAVFLRFLTEETEFLKTGDIEEEKKIRRTVAGMLLLHVMTSPTNMHGISSNKADVAGIYVQEMGIASAPYAYHSLLNHSCSPNVVRFSKLGSGKMKCFALRPIKKGMQIFDNYGSHHALEDRASRQYNLKFQYKFTCLCEACVNNWPTYFNMRPIRNLSARIRKEKETLLNPRTIEKLQKGDKVTAVKVFEPLCRLAEKLDPYIPGQELADVQESLKQCLVILEGLVPYGFSNMIEWNAIPPKYLIGLIFDVHTFAINNELTKLKSAENIESSVAVIVSREHFSKAHNFFIDQNVEKCE